MRSLRSIRTLGTLVLAPASVSIMLAQGPPGPPPPPTSNDLASISGSISQLNYGTEMEVTSFLMNGNVLVTFPPHVGWALASTSKRGQDVQVTGYSRSTPSGMQRMELQTLNAGGRTLTVPQPGQGTSYTASGKVMQLNYNREGDVDGLLLDNGVFAKTPPPLSASVTANVSVGSQVSVSGYSHQTMSGQTVVDVQSINGQTLAAAPPGPPPPPR